MKFEIGDAIKISLSTMKRVVNKVLPFTGPFVRNIVEIQDRVLLQVFRHAYQNRTRRDFFWVTIQVGLIPSQPSQLNATVWKQDCVLKLLILGAQTHPLSTTDTTTEPEAKQPRVLMDESDLILGGSGAADFSTKHLRIQNNNLITVTLELLFYPFFPKGKKRIIRTHIC